MARRNTPPPLRTGGLAWGAERVALGLSLAELARRSGVSKATLSLAENGRLIPTAAEWQAVSDVLRLARA